MPNPAPNPEITLLYGLIKEKLNLVMRYLTDDDRNLLKLRFVDKRPIKEIESITGLKSVKYRINQAKEHFKSEARNLGLGDLFQHYLQVSNNHG